MNAYYDNQDQRIIFDWNVRNLPRYRFICSGNFTADQMDWPKEVNGTVDVDTAAKTAWEDGQKPMLVEQYTSDGGMIDKRTVEILSTGFSHPSNPDVKFSLSEAAQISLTAISLKKDVIHYPFPLSMLGGESHMIADAAELDAIAMTALVRVSTIKTQGNAAKTWFRDPARTYAELSTWTDSRT